MPVVGRPEAAAVGGQEFVDEQEISFGVGAELKFRVGQNDAGLFGSRTGGVVKREAALAYLAKRGETELLLGGLVGQGEIVALLRFGGGGENGFGEKAGLDQVLGERSTPGGSFLFVFFPGTTGEVATDDTLDREGLGGAAAGEPSGVDFG